MKDPIKWVVLVLAIIVVGAIGYNQWRHSHPVVQAQPAAPVEPPPPPPAPVAKVEPPTHYPIEDPNRDVKPLPALGASDPLVGESLTALAGQKRFAEFFYPDGIIRRIVATVDNLAREKVALRLMPVKPVAGKFTVAGGRNGFVIAENNSLRYTAYVQLAESVDTKKVVASYVYFYPLFQQAYKDLGYPTGYFNDRLVAVIDNLLATPEVHGPLQLVQPKVMYQYADPKLEALTPGQKIIVRIGSANAARVKAKLQEIRNELISVSARSEREAMSAPVAAANSDSKLDSLSPGSSSRLPPQGVRLNQIPAYHSYPWSSQ
jgi:hypothetical protein